MASGDHIPSFSETLSCVVVFSRRHWPDFSNSEDMQKLGAEAFAFVNFARFAVPLRIGLALSTTPWIQKNIVDRFQESDGASPTTEAETQSSLEITNREGAEELINSENPIVLVENAAQSTVETTAQSTLDTTNSERVEEMIKSPMLLWRRRCKVPRR